ncbi:MAG: Xaa-Pro dipeptidase [Streptosporangiaceae bacterium]|jgi:Xaa-Pro aminopeptidase|nr:Xaa-Pro dipeptidase [Streptosporangiaceae bacterium]
MDRRRGALAGLLQRRGIDHALLYGADRSGSAIQWVTGWPVTREAAVIVSPGERDVLFVCYNNHVPNARQLAPDADVRPGGGSALAAALDLLASRATAGSRTGVIGPVPARSYDRLLAAAGQVEFLDGEYTRLRLVKSAEELEWLRAGARMSDDAVAALAREAGPGVTEAGACAILESAYIAAGGLTHIHFLAVTAMARPSQCVPAQWPSQRPLHAGDALSCEVSASYWGYPGQLLRTFSVGSQPSPLYRDLHEVADAAFDAMTARLRPGATADDLVAAAGVITAAGFTVYDDLVHGYGGGYLPPVLTRADLEDRRPAEFTFAAGMTVVIQPNVITQDERAGVQTGELVLVTEDGWESLHRFPRGFGRIG